MKLTSAFNRMIDNIPTVSAGILSMVELTIKQCKLLIVILWRRRQLTITYSGSALGAEFRHKISTQTIDMYCTKH